MPGRAIGPPLQQVTAPDASFSPPSFSPDGERILTRSDNPFRIRDIHTARNLTEFKFQGLYGHGQFSPDGQCVFVTAINPSMGRLWDAHSGEPMTDLIPLGSGGGSGEFDADGLQMSF